ncbi:hypothetical protein CPG37_09370 [Malaciobacter canalis]|uniref:Transformation system protein n=1 Tax=Malaciobacter canalis TaxID=1912871 RepID=A0ABX4LNK5_9BACT|nr:hypothetical protein [Malaciobacter canalis]PHO09477.1 hypothetical protein CPG37_09370 [Malaciobacter canalis]QEE33603.1 hypothetical protein ACAN_2152 [Malaciobacter canalis]
MKQNYLYKKIDKKIRKFTLLEKIELFLLPVFFTLIIIFLFENFNKTKKINISNNALILKTKDNKINEEKLFLLLSNYFEKEKIKINSLIKKKSNLELKIETSMLKLLYATQFIETISSNTNIKSLIIKNKSNMVKADIFIELSKDYEIIEKDIIKKSNLDFLKKRDDSLVEVKNTQSIVFDYVLINNKWEKRISSE